MQRWDLETAQARHRVEADTGGWSTKVRWWVDDVLVAYRRTGEDKVELKPDTGTGDDSEATIDPDALGRVTLRFSALGRPRRATWHPPGEAGKAALGLGGIDLAPEAGSPAAAYEEQVRRHPNRYAAQHTLAAAAGIVLPILLTVLAVQFAARIAWPDWNLPAIAWPDLPSIPRPDLPAIPWPDWSLPDWSLPSWLVWVLDQMKYVVPVVVAFVVARGEVRRRREQDQRRGLTPRSTDTRDTDRNRPDDRP